MNDLDLVILLLISSQLSFFSFVYTLYREKDVDIAFAQVAIDEYKVEFIFLLKLCFNFAIWLYFATLLSNHVFFPSA